MSNSSELFSYTTKRSSSFKWIEVHRQTDRQTHTHTHRQTDTQTDMNF